MKKIVFLALSGMLLFSGAQTNDNMYKFAQFMLQTPKAQAASTAVKPISKEDFSLNGIMLGMQYAEIRALLGYPLVSKTEQREYEMNYTTLEYPGAIITTKHHNDDNISDGRLDCMRVSDRYWTARGIGIGHSRADVEAAYGQAAYRATYTDPVTFNNYVQLQYEDDAGFNALIFYINTNTQQVDFIDMAEII